MNRYGFWALALAAGLFLTPAIADAKSPTPRDAQPVVPAVTSHVDQSAITPVIWRPGWAGYGAYGPLGGYYGPSYGGYYAPYYSPYSTYYTPYTGYYAPYGGWWY